MPYIIQEHFAKQKESPDGESPGTLWVSGKVVEKVVEAAVLFRRLFWVGRDVDKPRYLRFILIYFC